MEWSVKMVGLATLLLFLGTMSYSFAAKPFPELTYTAFTAKFLVILAEQNTMHNVIVKYDSVKMKASAQLIKDDGSTKDFVFDFNRQLMFEVDINSKKTCKAMSMDSVGNTGETYSPAKAFFRLFSSQPTDGGKWHIFSPNEFYSQGNLSKYSYSGSDPIDGIEADSWTADMALENGKLTYKQSYFFTPNQWNHEDSSFIDPHPDALPLLIERSGTSTYGGSSVKFYHLIEYVSFHPQNTLETGAFDIQTGISCSYPEGRSPKPMPGFPDVVSYDLETIDHKGMVDVSTVKYDKTLGLLEIIFSSGKIIGYDYNMGLRYNIDKPNKNCPDTRAIDPKQDEIATQKGGYAVGNSPLAFLFDDQKVYTYDGDSHEAMISTATFGQDQFSALFAKKNWQFSSGESQPPIYIIKNGIRFNFFNFKNSTDLRSTFRPYSKLVGCGIQKHADLKIRFYASDYPDRRNIESYARRNVSDAIATNAGVALSMIRIEDFNFVWDSQILTAKVSILDLSLDGYKYLYRHTSGKKWKKVSQRTYTKKDDKLKIINEVAKDCEDSYSSKTFSCRSFDICKGPVAGEYSVSLYLAQPTTEPVDTDRSCEHYVRAFDTQPGIDYDQAIKNLKDKTKKGQLKLTVVSNYGSGRTHNLQAVDVTERTPFEDINVYDNSRVQFEFTYNVIPDLSLVKSTSSFSDCKQRCLDLGSFSCESFQFCFATKQCSLSAKRPIDGTVNKHADKCPHFTKKYENDYQKFPGQTMLFKVKEVMKNIKNPGECARKCSLSSQYDCLSFDFCYDTLECALSTSHAFSANSKLANDSSSSCSHWSKNSLFDYDVSRKTELASYSSLGAVDVKSAEQCAFLCSKGYGGNGCVQFSFCSTSDKKYCQIASGSNLKLDSYFPSTICDTYTLKEVDKLVNSAALKSSKKGYSDASYGGLAVGMILVGLLIGGVLLFVLRRQGVLDKVIN